MNYSLQTIEAYEFMLPVLLEGFSHPGSLEYRIPKENDNFLGTMKQRLAGLRVAIQLVETRSKLLQDIRAYQADVANSRNWFSSSVVMSKEMIDEVAKSTREMQVEPLKKIEEIKKKIENIENIARHDIRRAIIGAE